MLQDKDLKFVKPFVTNELVLVVLRDNLKIELHQIASVKHIVLVNQIPYPLVTMVGQVLTKLGVWDQVRNLMWYMLKTLKL